MVLKGSEVRSGAFVVLAVIALTILIFSVGEVKTGFRSLTSYHAYIDDAKFLKAHDAVTYGGYQVGVIRSLDVAPERFGYVKVVIAVEKNVPVRKDSKLLLKQDGILGPKYLEISPGTPQAPPADPGAELKGVVIPAFTDISSALEEPLAQLGKVLEHLDAIVGSPENKDNVANTLSETRKLLAALNEEIPKLDALATETAEKAQRLIEDTSDTIKTNRTAFDGTLENVRELSAKLVKTADSVDQLLRDADGVILQNNKNVYETIRALRDTAYHLEQSARRIRSNPSILFFGAEETPEERRRADETESRLKGRARRFDKENRP